MAKKKKKTSDPQAKLPNGMYKERTGHAVMQAGLLLVFIIGLAVFSYIVSMIPAGLFGVAITRENTTTQSVYDVQNIVRIGSAGAISPKLKLKDIVIAMSAYTDSGYVSSFGFRGNAAPCCSYELLAKAMAYAKNLPCNVVCGPMFSSDAFYSDVSQTETLSRLGVLAVEMEAAALYLNAARAGKNALAICSISDSLVTGEELSAEERQIGFRNMMELGLSLA